MNSPLLAHPKQNPQGRGRPAEEERRLHLLRMWGLPLCPRRGREIAGARWRPFGRREDWRGAALGVAKHGYTITAAPPSEVTPPVVTKLAIKQAIYLASLGLIFRRV